MLHPKKDLFCYSVCVATTNCTQDTCWIEEDSYIECEHGRLYVITDCPEKIYKKLGKKNVISITKIGVGYTF